MTDQKPISQIISEKILALGMGKSEACKLIAKKCGCSEAAPYSWFKGTARPQRRYLGNLANVLRIHYNRLSDAWYVSKPVKKITVAGSTKDTFVPLTHPLITIALAFQELSEDNRAATMSLVKALDDRGAVDKSAV